MEFHSCSWGSSVWGLIHGNRLPFAWLLPIVALFRFFFHCLFETSLSWQRWRQWQLLLESNKWIPLCWQQRREILELFECICLDSQSIEPHSLLKPVSLQIRSFIAQFIHSSSPPNRSQTGTNICCCYCLTEDVKLRWRAVRIEFFSSKAGWLLEVDTVASSLHCLVHRHRVINSQT